MSELISGKEALIALANGESVQKRSDSWAGGHWLDISKKEPFNLDCFLICLNSHGETIKFRIKPRTISINGIEVPASAEDEDYHHQGIWILNSLEPKEYGYVVLDITDELPRYWWSTEDEIKQVVSALRSVFKPQ